MDRFRQGGKQCPELLAAMIAKKTKGYPYYAQALAYHVYEVSGKSIETDDFKNDFEKLMASERYGFEGIVQGLTGPQIALLKALAVDPQRRITTTEYMGRHYFAQIAFLSDSLIYIEAKGVHAIMRFQ